MEESEHVLTRIVENYFRLKELLMLCSEMETCTSVECMLYSANWIEVAKRHVKLQKREREIYSDCILMTDIKCKHLTQ